LCKRKSVGGGITGRAEVVKNRGVKGSPKSHCQREEAGYVNGEIPSKIL